MRRFLSFILIFLFLGFAKNNAFGLSTRYAIIICGSGGMETYQQKFFDWGTRLKQVCHERFRIDDENIILLTEKDNTDEPLATSNLESIDAAFAQFKQAATPDDELFVFLIGHGTYILKQSKFHIPGPDLSAHHLKELLDEFPAQIQVIVNASSSSAGFINVLSDPQRIICTATKSIDEKNATEFMEFFLQGLEQNQADVNYDQRISLLEAIRYSAFETLSWYNKNGLIATEHALIDDNGDGLGVRLIENENNQNGEEETKDPQPHADGNRSAQIILLDESFPSNAPQDKIDSYLAILDQIDHLKHQKGEIDESEYYQQLESLLIQAALIHREIRNSGK